MTERKKILIVEDERDVSSSIEDLLQENGYIVTGIARSKVEFQTLLDRERPDLILLDINLEGDTDGIDSLKSINNWDDILVIYITGECDPKVIEKASSTNPSGYLVKPYRDQELLANIQMAFHRHKEETEETKVALGNFFKDSNGTLDDLLLEFAKYLKASRKKLHLTQVNIADELGINYRHYQNIEAGKINLRLETFMKLINYFQQKS